MKNSQYKIVVIFLFSIIILVTYFLGCAKNNRLENVHFWTYLLQNVEVEENIDALVNSHYDLVVIDDVRTIFDLIDYDMSDAVSQIKNSSNSLGQDKIVVAYIDIGEAEDYRWYWEDGWKIGDPEFIVVEDPDGWSGNFPVKYWDEDWKDIIIYDESSYLNQLLEDGFDGIYLDWIEAFEDDDVIAKAKQDEVDPAEEMIDFIEEIAIYCREQDQDFIIIAQNALELGEYDEYLEIIDGVAQEQIWFDGLADANDTAAEGDRPMPATGEFSTEYYLEKLEPFVEAGLPIFTVDYALKKENADKAYRESLERGFIPYVSMRSLSKLSETPPPNY